MYNFKNILINNYELFEFLEYHDKKNEIFEKYVNKDNIVINIMNKQNKDILNIDKYLSFIKNKRYCYFIYLYNYDSNPLSYDLEMFNDNKYIRKVLYNISYNLKTINNIEIFYENIYILDYFVNLIEHKKNMVKMKLYIFLEFIIIFLFNEEFDFVFIFSNNELLIQKMLDWFFFNGYIIFDEIIYNTYNKIMKNIINAIKIIYELKKPTIIQNNYIYFEVIDETDYEEKNLYKTITCDEYTDNYEKLMIYIKYASNITPIRFFWISSCIRFTLYTTY